MWKKYCQLLQQLRILGDYILISKPFSVVAEIIELLRQRNLLKVEKNGDIKFNSKGLEYLGSLKIAPKRTYTCHACEGRGINFSKLEDLIKKI